MTVQFRLLGSVEAQVDGEPVDLGHARRQCVLAALLVEANRPVSVDQLIDRVWADQPPNQARNALHGYLGKLRSALAAIPEVGISRSSGGYVLTVHEETVDLHRFRQLLIEARAAGDDRALVLYQQALGLWRGEAFAGMDNAWLTAVRTSLDEERFAAELDYADVRLRCGQHAELLPALSRHADRRPLDERLAAQLMLALYRSGRQADALEHYRRTRQSVADELGTDLGQPLQQLHQQMLRGDQSLSMSSDVLPRNDLPGDVADFTGRANEIRQLLTAWPGGATVLISAIDGMAGIGKTTLALRAAHHLADRYPDGQLFLDLHGHTEGRRPVEPAAALATLLRAVDVPIEQIPASIEERASRWRAELAQRNILVLLDNAATAAQVRPLLPGTAGSLTLITSRRRLADLDATCSLSLDLLPPADAITLFTRVAGMERVAAEPGAVAQVAQLCGYLPLALRIAAARLRTRPMWTVDYLAGRLGAERRRLAELSAGDRSVAAAFALSYDHLDPAQQRLFRLLGQVPGPHWDAYLAAALTDTAVADAEHGLEQLLDVHLLTQPAPGRYQLHDLLGEHARAVAQREETAAAVERMLGYYRTIGAYAVETGFPVPGLAEPGPAVPGAPVFGTCDQGLAWLKSERPNLSAAYQMLPDTPETLPARLDLLMLLSYAQCFGGQGAEGLETTRRLLALIPAEDDARRIAAVRLCATVKRLVGSPGAAKSVLLGELRRAPDRLAAQTAPLRLRLAVEHLSTGDVLEATELLDELDALDLGTAVRFAVAVLRAIAAYLSGDIPSTLIRLDNADRLMRELNPARITTWIEATAWLSWVEVKACRHVSGLARMDRTIEIARGGGPNYVVENHVVASVLAAKAFMVGRMGRLAEAAALAQEAVNTARQIDLPETTAVALTAQSLVLAWIGDYNTALTAGTEAAGLAASRQDWTSILARCAPGLVLIYSGNVDAGLANVQAACDEYEFVIRDETEMLVLLEALAHAEATRGRSENATEWADRAERVRHPAHVTNAAIADLIRAHSLTCKDPARSAELALGAAEVLGSAELRLEEGRARLRAGLSLANASHGDCALAQLEAAVTLFDTCGSRDLHAQATVAHNELVGRNLSHRQHF